MKITETQRNELIKETHEKGKMNLLPDFLKEQFKDFPLYSQDGKKEKAQVIVKYFNPMGSGTFLALEGSPEGEDFVFFGYCYITEWEYGYFSLKELQKLQDQGHLIEIDLYSNCKTMKDYLEEIGVFEEYKRTFLDDEEEEEK